MKDVCMRCEYGKGYFVGGKTIYIGKDGSIEISTKHHEIVNLPANTIKFCPWCGKRLHPTEKGGVDNA